jgi:transcriptional regulator with XRE-family HTH domain
MSDTAALRPEPKGRPDEAHEIFGRQLRYLRESQRVSPSGAGRHIEGSASKISRLETGRVGVKEDDLLRLLALYGVTDTLQISAMLQFASCLNGRQWWRDENTVSDGWLSSYLVLESIAEQIRTYEVRFIPGLLQTAAYAEAVIRCRYTDRDEIRRRVRVRMRRQQMILKERPSLFGEAPRLWALVDEAALTEGFAGRRIMREQIDFLLQTAEQHSAVIQVLPSGAGGGIGVGSSFSVLRFRGKALLDVVYLEHLDNATFLDSPSETDPYRIAMERLAAKAGDPRHTTSKLERHWLVSEGPEPA